MAKIKALIFDLDGTLLDTIEDITYSCNRALVSAGLEPYPSKAYKLMVGDGVDRLIERALANQNADPGLFDQVKHEYLRIYLNHQFDWTKPYPGIMELLNYAKKQGISCHVLSNKPDSDTQSVIRHFFPYDTFATVSGKKEGFKPKPDPALLKTIIQDINPENLDEILYIGDTFTDMKTALNAGLNKIGVLWGFRDRAELNMGHPEHIVSHPKEIIQILKKA